MTSAPMPNTDGNPPKQTQRAEGTRAALPAPADRSPKSVTPPVRASRRCRVGHRGLPGLFCSG